MRYFITAIDTNIGKTIVSAILAKALNYPYWKPIQSGDLDSSDTMKILNLAPNIECYDEAYRLEFPLSPHESARLSKVKLNLNEIKVPSKENLIIEGAGGIMVPLNDNNLVIDIAKMANAEIILVIKHYLGSINHTLLSIDYLQRNNYKIKGLIIVGDRLESSERAIKEHTGLDILYNFEHSNVIDKNYIDRQAIKIKNDFKEKDKKYIWHPFDQMKGADILPIVKGEGSLVFDEDGKDYIDGFSSWWVNAHGHSNSYIANKISEQLHTLEHVAFGGFTHPQAINLSERLINITPKNIKKIFFSDNGSTANEIALKMSIQFWNNKGKPKDKFIALEGDYHGDTFGSMCLTSRGGFNEPFEKFMFDVDFIQPPQKDNINEVLEQFEEILKTERVAAFIFEPLVQGAYGMKMHDAVGLSKMMKLAKEYGVICIADEVFTGFGRTGTWFACNQLSELPDFMCLSKALTGGFLPLGLTLVSQEIYNGFYSDIPTHTFLHGHSFTGNPLSCCAANASLDLFQQEKTWTRIAVIEKSLEKFCKIVSTNKNVREARHLGIILAIEIDAGGKSSYFNNIGKIIYKELLNKGVILRPLGNTIVVVPPYCITDDELNKMYSAIVEVLSLLN